MIGVKHKLMNKLEQVEEEEAKAGREGLSGHGEGPGSVRGRYRGSPFGEAERSGQGASGGPEPDAGLQNGDRSQAGRSEGGLWGYGNLALGWD